MARSPVSPAEPASFGPRYTSGTSFRARAEARQRRYRADVLGAGWDAHGHWLDAAAVGRGANFVVPVAHLGEIAGEGSEWTRGLRGRYGRI